MSGGVEGNLYLIGYRGTGKSTIAELLAAALGWKWVDMDSFIETRHGTTIRSIFEREGEACFRAAESAVLQELSRRREQVIATGGGVVLNAQNRAILRATGRIAWLTADAQTLWQRISADKTTAERRPKLTVGGPREVDELLQRREPFYRECADCTVDTVGRSPEEIAALVRAQLKLG
jgi:shikimate kinase